MRCPFVVGDEVEFIGTGKYLMFARDGYIVPVRGVVYTVREVRPDNGLIGLLFREIRNRLMPQFGLEPGFAWEEYRKVIRRKTDISIFTAMLKTKQKELVR